MSAAALAAKASGFVEELKTSAALAERRASQIRRVERAGAWLEPSRIHSLTDGQLRQLFFDTNAFGFWNDKGAEFERRRAKAGPGGLQSTLQFLIERANDGLTPADLKEIQANTGIGIMLATELASYRFPLRCWVYSPGSTLPALAALGWDVKTGLPRGQKSGPFVYAALGDYFGRIRDLLSSAGLDDPDNLVADLFLWWSLREEKRHIAAESRKRPLRHASERLAGAALRRQSSAIATAATGTAEPRQGYRCRPIDTGAVLEASLEAAGLYFTRWQLASFYTALQVKGFVILSGISGTGKTRLAQHFATLLDTDAAEDRRTLFLPVRPDWRDSRSLLGYRNPLTNEYEWTEFLRFLVRARADYAGGTTRPWFVILDEMNLARVEYYFADLLSVLESGRDDAGLTREALRFAHTEDLRGKAPPEFVHLPPNLYIVGTVNVDETTHGFSPRVLDRAFALELTEVDLLRTRPQSSHAVTPSMRNALRQEFMRESTSFRSPTAARTPSPEIAPRLQKLNLLLQPHNLHFGYRVFDEITCFVDHASRNRLFAPVGGAGAAFDAATLMKVLPKFHGTRARLERPLRSLLAWCVTPDDPDHTAIHAALRPVETAGVTDAAIVAEHELERLSFALPATARRARKMLQALYTEGFAAFG